MRGAGGAASTGTAEATVLLVEDNRGDVGLVERAFEARELPADLAVAETADEALDRIHGRGEYAGESRPALLLLDLNLPTTTGQQLLEELAEDAEARQLPVVVLTNSKSPRDIDEAYAAGANACVIKPVDPDEFADRVAATVRFWIEDAQLPVWAGGGRR